MEKWKKDFSSCMLVESHTLIRIIRLYPEIDPLLNLEWLLLKKNQIENLDPTHVRIAVRTWVCFVLKTQQNSFVFWKLKTRNTNKWFRFVVKKVKKWKRKVKKLFAYEVKILWKLEKGFIYKTNKERKWRIEREEVNEKC